MSFKIVCQTQGKVHCFEVVGEVASHLDSIARYIRTKVKDRHGVVLDIRAVTKRPRADQLFIHVLKYPSACLRKIALVDVNENLRFCSLYGQLVRTRGYQVGLFDEVNTAIEWIVGDGTAPNVSCSRFGLLTQVVAFARQSLNPMRLLHTQPGLNNFLFVTLPTIWR